MPWFWVLGIIFFFILLLCLTRVGANVKLTDSDLTADIRFGLLRFRILPTKEKKVDPAKKSKKDAKEAKAAAQKAARKAEKDARKAVRKGEKISVKIDRLQLLLADIQSLFDAVWPSLKRALNRTRKGVRIHPLQLSLIVGAQEDPAAGAQIYGYVHAGVWTVMPALEQVLDIPQPFVHVGIDFESPDTCLTGECGVTIRIGTLLAVVFSAGIPALKWFLKWNRKKNVEKQRQGVSPAAAETKQKG